MSITIKQTTKQETAYEKRITFTREGEEYSVLLCWSAYDGFDLDFLDGRRVIDTPEWAVLWDEDDDKDSLEYYLDSLTDEVLEEAI